MSIVDLDFDDMENRPYSYGLVWALIAAVIMLGAIVWVLA